MAGVELVCYDGDPLNEAQLVQEFGLDQGPYIYVVATTALHRERRNLPTNNRVNKEHLLFHRALREMMNQPLLTRAEERIALGRAARLVASDPAKAQQLRHDILTWSEALAAITEREINMAALSPQLRALLVDPGVGQVLESLQQEFRAIQQQYNKPTYEEAANAFLSGTYSPTPIVVMEGFTFLTPLQLRFLTQSAVKATVYVLYSYRTVQAYGFAALNTTYNAWLGQTSPRLVSTASSTPTGNLAVLQDTLFTAAQTSPQTADGTLTIESYRHRWREIAACIERIRTYLAQGIAPKQIAVVTRNRAEIESLLQETANAQQLQDQRGNAVGFGIPPRLLLLTPVGQFILALYQIWDSNDLIMSADAFEAIVASGWLGSSVQSTLDRFNALKAQMFARCSIRADWQTSLQQLDILRQQIPTESRQPVAGIDERIITLWTQSVDLLDALCSRLFAQGQGSIGDHIRLLLDELARLAPEEMLQTEREVLERIEEVLRQLADSTSLPMTSEEFGEVLNSLVQERQREEEEDNSNSPAQAYQIVLATPESVDNCRHDVVFYLAADSERVPRAYPEPWPFYELAITEHQEKERYFFLTVVRAARLHLHLSYAQADEEGTYRPSQYLERAAGTLGWVISQVQDVSVNPGTLPTPTPPTQLPPARRNRYTLAEIAHFALCPFRYKLEALDGRARQYRDSYQMRLLAQSIWLHKIFDYLQIQTRSVASTAIKQTFRDAKNATEQDVKAAFPGFRDLDWVLVSRNVEDTLDKDANHYADNTQPLKVVAGTSLVYVIPDGNRAIEVIAEVPHIVERRTYHEIYTGDLMREEWLIPGKPDNLQPGDVEGVTVLPSLFQAIQWWTKTLRVGYKYQRARTNPPVRAELVQEYEGQRQQVKDWIALIETGRYPKNPGDHCNQCPVRSDCIGLPEESQL